MLTLITPKERRTKGEDQNTHPLIYSQTEKVVRRIYAYALNEKSSQ